MLSPATISALAAAHVAHEPKRADAAKRTDRRLGRQEPERVVMWRCPVCDELHDDEDDAADCCREKDDDHADTNLDDAAFVCPVCLADHNSHGRAADCCLWHDLAIEQRTEVAHRVEEGSTWLQAIDAVAGPLPQQLRHLINEMPETP